MSKIAGLKKVTMAGVITLGMANAGHAMMADPGADATPAMKKAHALLSKMEFEAAIPVIQGMLLENNNDADSWNLLGFSYRKTKQFDLAWDAYERALALEPTHLRANEYIGELYIQQGNMEGALAQLERLKKLCPTGCMELSDLEKSLAKVQ